MKRRAAVIICGPPATGKSTLAAAVATQLDAAILDLDDATGRLTQVISELISVPDQHDPALARLTRSARYGTLLDLAAANLKAGRPVVLAAPFSAERAQQSAWAATTRRLEASAADPTMVWLHLAPEELVRRLTRRGLARDEYKIRDPASFLAGHDFGPPVVPHLALDASEPGTILVSQVLEHLSR